MKRIVFCLFMVAQPVVFGEEAGGPLGGKKGEVTPELKAALEKLVMPKVKINVDEWSVDVEASVCEDYGLLEVVACVKDTRDHESVVRTEAKPSHIHTALLLLGARPGSPAMQQVIDQEAMRFRSILPSGSPVDVSLVITDEKGVAIERPINEFIVRGKDYDAVGQEVEKEGPKEKFPTHTFLFAGSVLLPPAEEGAPRQYVADTEGNVISISTFGDEVLCQAGIHDRGNETLIWQADDEILKPGNVILRLRPHRPEGEKKAPEAKPEK